MLVVSVERAVIGKPEVLKEILPHQQTLETVFCFLADPHQPFAAQRDLFERILDSVLETEILCGVAESVEIGIHRADVFRDRHIVVVENDDQLVVAGTVVQRFVRHSARKRSVADHDDGIGVAAGQPVCRRDPDACRNGSRTVAGSERVANRFVSARKARKPAELPQRVKLLPSSRQQLVNVTLMPDVENETVFRTVEDAVHCDRQFHGAEIGSEMSAVLRNDAQHFRADFVCEGMYFVPIQTFDVLRGIDPFQ